MLTALVSLLVGIDLILLFLFLRNNKSTPLKENLLYEITEERKSLSELRQSIQEDLENVHAQSKEILKKVNQIAVEAELEVKSGSESIGKELEGIVATLTQKFEAPIKELSSRQHGIERLLQRIEREKEGVAKILVRAEKICQFFNDKVPYQDILEELQDKKYQDARRMITQGYNAETIAKELGMTLAEIEVIANLGV